eukprot:1177904-Prorocentrum_minimum.AAC.4
MTLRKASRVYVSPSSDDPGARFVHARGCSGASRFRWGQIGAARSRGGAHPRADIADRSALVSLPQLLGRAEWPAVIKEAAWLPRAFCTVAFASSRGRGISALTVRSAMRNQCNRSIAVPPFAYCTTRLPGVPFEGNLDALGGSLYLHTLRRPFFYFSNSELGPYGVSSDHPMYNPTYYSLSSVQRPAYAASA